MENLKFYRSVNLLILPENHVSFFTGSTRGAKSFFAPKILLRNDLVFFKTKKT